MEVQNRRSINEGMGKWESSVLKVKSSIVIEVIRVISNFFFFFHERILQAQKV